MSSKKTSDEEPLELTPDQEEMVRQAYESKKKGQSRTSEQLLDSARAKVKGWLLKKSA